MKDNYCVIMGGGIGSRFWPFSRESYPKQFLDFFGSGRSLLQMTFDRFAKIIPTENIYIVTNESYADLIKEQLPELAEEQILLEPARRNTAPCIAYAAYHIKACNPEANIVVAPSDHLILKEDVFLRDVQKALDFVKRNRALVTLGIKPSRPETGYGYIQSSDTVVDDFTKVKTFTEKPNLELAKVFMESGEFFWNSGKLLYLLATSAPCTPNVSQLSKDIETSRATVMNYIKYLTDARLMNMLYPVGESFPKKPSKVYMYNSNLMYPIRPMEVNAGAVRESFFYNQLLKDNKLNEGIKNAHFLVNTMYNFRIEENMKVKNNPDMYYAVDKTEIGEGNMIPLWLFGFLY